MFKRKKSFDFFGTFLNTVRGGNVVHQHGSIAGGRTVRGDMCGGNMSVRSIDDLADGSFIGGDLKVGTPDRNEDKILANLAKMDLEVGGRIIINGKDVTAEYKALRNQK
jgi:hypothetical protein